jgi:glycosyltransferase involved in cell wall biosynthesis
VSEAPPTVTAILLTYNCADFVAEAVRSVLAQDCLPMEVIVSDDASGDETFRILEREIAGYAGPHRVSLRRRSATSGSKSAHLNDVFHRASGEILISFDGDDLSRPTRVRKIVEAFQGDPAVQAVSSGYSLIDEQGRRVGTGRVPRPAAGEDARPWFSRVDAYASGATLAIRREVVEAFGSLDPGIHEDIVLPFRASLLGEVAHIDEELVQARRWAGSLTADRRRYDSVQAYRAGMLRGIRRARKHLGSRLADLYRAEGLMPDRAAEFDQLREVIWDSMADAKATADLVSPSLWARVRCFFRLARSGAYRDERLQHAGLVFLPRSYLRYKRRALGAGGEGGTTRSF